jgi:UDP-N-acetylglucosamine--N-acetylmuramyl-(pentapeptide) pyrophosphoryl-undecaprenol N-acetylglucosamine transferase
MSCFRRNGGCDASADRPHVIFAGGGTGGHLFPGLAVAEALRRELPPLAITFCGTGRPFEREHVERAGFTYASMPACPMPRTLAGLARFLRDQPRAISAARRLLKWCRPTAVVGLGGYASVPLVRSAQRHRIPVMLLEQNLIPGRATRWLARRGAIVCAAFAESRVTFQRHIRFHATGNPVRGEIAALARQDGAVPRISGPHWNQVAAGKTASITAEPGALASGQTVATSPPRAGARTSVEFISRQGRVPRDVDPRHTLLVLGGSQGARSLNRAVPAALATLASPADTWRVIHQAGAPDAAEVAALYRQTPYAFEVAEFIGDMATVYQRADLVVCRAGGTTLAEVACAGLPAVLVPYPHAARDHQRWNADWYAERGAARVVADDGDPQRLAETLRRTLGELFADQALLRRMADSIQALARPTATDAVAGMLRMILAS